MAPASERLLRHAPAAVRLRCGAVRPPQGVPRSHLGDGCCVLWLPVDIPAGLRLAVDAELAHRPVPSALARWSGTADPAAFWPRWTRIEASCKLRDVPVAVWLRTRGFRADPALALTTFIHRDAVVTCGTAPNPPRRTR